MSADALGTQKGGKALSCVGAVAKLGNFVEAQPGTVIRTRMASKKKSPQKTYNMRTATAFLVVRRGNVFLPCREPNLEGCPIDFEAGRTAQPGLQ